MSDKERLIDALELVIKISKKVTPMVAAGCSEKWIYSKIMECIADAPTVEARPVVYSQWDDYSTSMMECRHCKRHVPRHRYKYCPHCGAVIRKLGKE